MQKKPQFAKNMIQTFLTSGLIVDFLFIVTLPKNKPPLATAMSPETPIELAKVTAPKTPAIVNAVSENGSFTKV